MLLMHTHGIDPGLLNGISGLRRHIAAVRPDLARHGAFDMLAAFTGLSAPSPQPKQRRESQPKKYEGKINPNTDAFLESYEWRRVRMMVLKRDGARCKCCGATPADGVRMHVDHIKPRRMFPHLALDLDNLQVLCEECNHGKGNWDQTDWRDSAANDDNSERQHIQLIVKGE